MIYDKIILDFDDTIWSRDEKYVNESKDIVKFLNDNFYDKAVIVSGNSFKSIENKLNTVFDSILDFKLDIWADCNSINYKRGKINNIIKDFNIVESALKLSRYMRNELGYESDFNYLRDYNYLSNLKFKPLPDDTRKFIKFCLDNSIFKLLDIRDCKAVIAGKTTLDIMHKDNNKSRILSFYNIKYNKIFYIGDEIDTGNDKDIASKCCDYVNVRSILDTKNILESLL